MLVSTIDSVENGERPAKRSRPTVAERLANGDIGETQALELTREAALRTLDRAAKSRSDLAASLSRRGYPVQVLEPLLDRLEKVGLIDDSAYANAMVRVRSADRGLSRRAIALELGRRGISSEVAAEALAQIDPTVESEAIARLATKALARTQGLDRQTRLRRAVGALQRKGYDPTQSYAAAQSALTAESDEW